MRGGICILFLVAVTVSSAFATPVVPQTASLYLNKKGIVLEAVPAAWRKEAARTLGVEEVILWRQENVSGLSLHFSRKEQIRKIGSSVDLSPWFSDKSCAKSWKRFDECTKKGKDPADEALFDRLDREFVVKVMCREVHHDDDRTGLSAKASAQTVSLPRSEQRLCENPDFLKWTFHWKSPYLMSVETELGKPWEFRNLAEAKKSLHRINTLLKKVLPGARFPEDSGEGRSEFEVYHEDAILLPPENAGKKTAKLLRMLQESGLLHGLDKEDIETIERSARGGKVLFYLPPGCEHAAVTPEGTARKRHDKVWGNGSEERTKPGWHAVSNNIRFRFDKEGCPRPEILR